MHRIRMVTDMPVNGLRMWWGWKMKTLITQITDCIEHTYNIDGKDYSKRIIVYPCGDVGIQVINIMKMVYNIEPAYIIDNMKCRYNSNIKNSSFLERLFVGGDLDSYVLLLASTNKEYYGELKRSVEELFNNKNLIELECMKTDVAPIRYETKIGRYSYGPICRNHPYIKQIGAFCSFAPGVEYVTSHQMNFVTTHTMLSWGKDYEEFEKPYEQLKGDRMYFPGACPNRDKLKKQGRAIIGNDVWLGKNVTVINSCNIGDGVIAGAGAVITKDVPDYAIVVGIPARIVKYRYNFEQINMLKKIAWWDWSDEQILERYDDFYLPIEDFIEKYK